MTATVAGGGAPGAAALSPQAASRDKVKTADATAV